MDSENVETASAFTYLHGSDIIHGAVKTGNILLDNSFCVKVADFGLSRLYPNDVTHVSTAPRGTSGYVGPEYQLCYQLTSKSDVYSFGVVLIELISYLPADEGIEFHHGEGVAQSYAHSSLPNTWATPHRHQQTFYRAQSSCLGYQSLGKSRIHLRIATPNDAFY
ncbi:unnamed protein product [Trifolium pratense]|uniref:Uncharacterized protein n=1 Tax=Trifolium pratense TaxID=57577 RepID=A0ACB0JWL2_TRIPR|nr:unnamed protein product [Trifolium pratense]